MAPRLLCVVVLILGCALTGRAGDERFALALKGGLTTNSRLFPNPRATEPFSRAQVFEFKDFFGYGIEISYMIPGTNVAVGVGSDLIEVQQSRTMSASSQRLIPVEDGFRMIPVELTGYFHIPVTGGAFTVFMGGGAGIYFGSRTYRVAGVEAASVGDKTGYGIHVLGGVGYRITDFFSLRAEMKFRDAQFEGTNQFSVPRVQYGDIFVTLNQSPFPSAIHADGMLIQVEGVIHF